MSGDITPLDVDRLDSGAVVLQSAVPVGTGSAMSLRWQNNTASAVLDESVRASSGGCTTDCTAEDVYQPLLRARKRTKRPAVAWLGSSETTSTVQPRSWKKRMRSSDSK